jgi:hypothetical protein
MGVLPWVRWACCGGAARHQTPVGLENKARLKLYCSLLAAPALEWRKSPEQGAATSVLRAASPLLEEAKTVAPFIATDEERPSGRDSTSLGESGEAFMRFPPLDRHLNDNSLRDFPDY